MFLPTTITQKNYCLNSETQEMRGDFHTLRSVKVKYCTDLKDVRKSLLLSDLAFWSQHFRKKMSNLLVMIFTRQTNNVRIASDILDYSDLIYDNCYMLFVDLD